MTERGEHLLVHGSARRKIAHRNGDVVDHAACPHAGAADLTSLYMIESIRAWNEASMMLGDTPTVVQCSPASSSLSISTRVTASVPALRRSEERRVGKERRASWTQRDEITSKQ